MGYIGEDQDQDEVILADPLDEPGEVPAELPAVPQQGSLPGLTASFIRIRG